MQISILFGSRAMNAISTAIKQSLLTLIELHHISEAELCRRINIPQSTISRLLNGATNDPRASTLTAIAKYFDVSVDQLIGLKPIPKTLNKEAIAAMTTFIPLLSIEDIKSWTPAANIEQQDKYRQWIETESFNKNCFSLKIDDESMWPQFAAGTILVVNPALNPKNRDFIVCYLSKERRGICRQYLSENNIKILKPINQSLPSIKIGKNDKIVGVITQARNDFEMS
jgi:SOS-response transcriptional repressor LexA